MKHIPERRRHMRRKDEEALRRSEERYRTILEEMVEGYYEIDLAGNFTFVNDSLCSRYGYSREEMMGMNYRQYTDETTARKIYEAFTGVYRTGKPIEFDNHEIIRKDGTKYSIGLSISLIKNAAGKPVGFRGISRDITERKRTEETLRQSEEKYRTILESIEEGYYELNLAGNFTFFNDSMRQIIGYSREELMGMNNRVYTNKETAKKLFQAFNEVYRTGKLGEVIDYEIIRKDGTNKYIEISISLHKDSSGKLVGFRGIVRDVTERKRAEDTLRESEERFRLLVEHSKDAFFLHEFGKIIDVNQHACESLGYTREELLDLSLQDIDDDVIPGKHKEKWKQMVPGEPIFMEGVHRRKDGTTFPVEVRLVAFYSGGRRLMLGLVRDVTERKRAEEALRQSEEKYRNILENMQEAYYEIDLVGNFTFVNDAVCRHLGYTREELIGMNSRQVQDETTAKKIYQIFSEVYRAGEPVKAIESKYIRKDGTNGTYELSVSLIRDAEGKPVGFKGISRDITERKLAEEALRRSEEKYRTIIENMQDGYFENDLAGNYIFVNDSMCQHFGYTMEELIGMNNRQFQDETTARKIYHAYNELYRTGEPLKAVASEYTRKDGTKGISELSVSLIRDAGGKPIGFRGTSRDVTERKRAEEILRQSEERYRTIIENMQDGYFENDLAGNYTFVNDSMCRIFGYSREELIGMNNQRYTNPENSKKLLQAFNKVYRTGELGQVFDYEIIRKDWAERNVETSFSIIRDALGKSIGFRGVIRDITERKQAEEALKRHQEELIQKNKNIEESRRDLQLTLERLRQAYQELKTSQSKILQQEKMASIGQLAAGVAHEINNPMSFIASNLGTLDKYIRRLIDFIQTQSEVIKSLKDADEIKKLKKKRKELKLDYVIEDVKGLIAESLDGSERVQKIVLGLNRFSRVDEEEYKDADINECIESAINIVWNELKYKSTLKKDYGKLPRTKCYPQQINQVFINLLINAVNSIEKQGTITIKTWNKDRSIWMVVSDTGCGIPQESLGKIFEPFFTTKDVGKGTGLGLSITYEIVQRHKGDITVKSEVGKGTTFTIRMPVV